MDLETPSDPLDFEHRLALRIKKKTWKTVFGLHGDLQIWAPFNTWTKNPENQWKSFNICENLWTSQKKNTQYYNSFENPGLSIKIQEESMKMLENQ